IFAKRDGHWRMVGGQETKVNPQPDFTAVTSQTPSSELNARERLIGSWKQVSDEEILPDGSVVHLDEVGLLTYDRSGHMSGQTMRRSAPMQRIPSDATYQSNGYDAYFGTFTVDEDRHIVTHHVEGAVARQLVG